MEKNLKPENSAGINLSRREFIKTGSMAAVVAAISGTGVLFAGSGGKIKVGLIGCGGRGLARLWIARRLLRMWS